MADLHHPDDDVLGLYALGALDADEAEAVERHLATCAACRPPLARWRGELAALAESVEPQAPPPGARQALLARLGVEEGSAEPGSTSAPGAAPGPAPAVPRRRRPGLLLPLAASFLVGAVVGAIAVRQAFVDDVRELAARADAVAAERAAATDRVERLQGELAAARAALSLAPAPEAVPLAGLAPAPEARGRVFVDRGSGRALFVARGLPALAEGRTYQLWRIVEGRPRPAGLLEAGEGSLVVEGIGATDEEVWAVTVEPRGGVAAPTGEMVLSS